MRHWTKAGLCPAHLSATLSLLQTTREASQHLSLLAVWRLPDGSAASNLLRNIFPLPQEAKELINIPESTPSMVQKELQVRGQTKGWSLEEEKMT